MRQGIAERCLAAKEAIGSCTLIAQIVEVEPEELAAFAEELLQKLGSGVVAIGVKLGDKCQLLIAVTPDLKHLSAVQLIKEAAPSIQGGGGGKPTLAQAGGKKPDGLPAAFDKIRDLLGS
jgi:alanyl-tRNA synthetase